MFTRMCTGEEFVKGDDEAPSTNYPQPTVQSSRSSSIVDGQQNHITTPQSLFEGSVHLRAFFNLEVQQISLFR
jgi:hypothetical protein